MTKLASVFVLISCAMAQDQNVRLQFDWDKWPPEQWKKVDVNLEGPLLEMASKFLGDKGDEAQGQTARAKPEGCVREDL